jgi:hypothetical protein
MFDSFIHEPFNTKAWGAQSTARAYRLFGGIGYWPLTVTSQPTAPYVFFDPICLDSTTIMQYHHPALIKKTGCVWSRATSEVTFIYLRLADPTTRPFPSWRLHLQIDDASGFKNRASNHDSKSIWPPSGLHLPKNPSKTPCFIRSQDQTTHNFRSNADSNSTSLDIQALSGTLRTVALARSMSAISKIRRTST